MIYTSPAQAAARLIDEYCFSSPQQLNIEDLVYAEQLVIRESRSGNFYGRLMHNKDSGVITLGGKVSESGARCFTIAHELGHFLLERNFTSKNTSATIAGGLFTCVEKDVISFKTSRMRENKANEFAAELLMYKPWFADYVKKRDIDAGLIKELANYFKVSLTAAAIRYAEIGKYPITVICSKNSTVQWHYPSPYFPVKYIPKGYKVRKESGAYDYFTSLRDRQAVKEIQTDLSRRNGVETEYDMVPAYTWFSEDFKCPRDLYLYEQNIVMKSYESVLTLLWVADF